MGLGSFEWTEERERKLVQLLNEGLNSTQISERFGVSRSSILGKKRRMGLSDSVGPRGENWKPKERKYFSIDTNRFPSAVPFAEVNRRQCQFILGSREENSGACCGAEVKNGSPYCQHHHDLCYWMPDPRNPRAERFILKDMIKNPPK